jgi:hypothetical protein
MSTNNRWLSIRVMTLIGLSFIWSGLCADTQVFEVWGPTGEGAGIRISAGNDDLIYNPDPGCDTNHIAQTIVDFVNSVPGFSAYRVGNKITIVHRKKITIEKVNIANTRVNSAAYNNGQAQISRNNLYQFTGLANGDGMILFQNGDLSLSLATLPGQTPMEIVDALTDALHEIVPDDGLYSFGREFSSASFQDPPVPIGSVDLGIWALGNRNLLLTECTSTDTGIVVTQDPVNTETIPTLTEWGLIFLVLATLGIGVLRIIRI